MKIQDKLEALGMSSKKSTIYLCRKNVAQLFIDDELMDSKEAPRRTLHQPLKEDGGDCPLLALEGEFGGFASTLEANGTILFDPRLNRYVMFAIGYASSSKGWDRTRRYRFTSEDGLNWIHGDDGHPQVVYPLSKEDLFNPKTGNYATNTDMFSCVYDAEDAQYPYKGWQWFPKWDDHGAMLYTRSRDGMHWERGPVVAPYNARSIAHDGILMEGPGDCSTIYKDPLGNRFFASLRYWSPADVGFGNRLRSRAFLFLDRLEEPLDLSGIEKLDLVPAAAEKNGDQPWDEYYISTAWRYESVWLGALKVWHGGGHYPYSAAGAAFLKLVVSRDGLHWKKVPFPNENGIPEVFLPNGPEGGNGGRNDGGYVTLFNQGPLRIGDELIYYYGASSYGKNNPEEIRVSGGGIFRARLRLDGFVSVDQGTFTTRLLEAEGENLFMNSSGPVAVAVLEEADVVLDSARVDHDAIRHQLLFNGKPLAALAGLEASSGSTHPFKLRFTVKPGGELYSFTIA